MLASRHLLAGELKSIKDLLLLGKGGLILYSVGPDLKDDGGTMEYGAKLLDIGIKNGDMTFVIGSAFVDRWMKPSRESLEKSAKERGQSLER